MMGCALSNRGDGNVLGSETEREIERHSERQMRHNLSDNPSRPVDHPDERLCSA